MTQTAAERARAVVNGARAEWYACRNDPGYHGSIDDFIVTHAAAEILAAEKRGMARIITELDRCEWLEAGLVSNWRVSDLLKRCRTLASTLTAADTEGKG